MSETNIIAEIIKSSIWSASSVADTPELELVRWAVFEVSSPLWEGRSRHFCGYNMTEREGRVSSEIKHIDMEYLIGITRSGRVYKLSGPPGFDKDGIWVWDLWCQRNKCTDITDVTSEYLDYPGEET